MTHKVAVLGMVERFSGSIQLKVLKHADGKNIQPLLKEKITSDSELVTDGFGGYSGLDKHFTKHIKLNHQKGKRKEGIYHLNQIEGFFTTIKRAVIGQYHRISTKHMQSYMDEIVFKQNTSRDIIFNLLLVKACAKR